MENSAKPITIEDLQCHFKDLAVAQLNTEKSLREFQQSTKEFQQSTKEFQQNTGKALQESSEQINKLSKSINEANGNFTNKWGLFLENLIKGGLVKLLNERTIQVSRIQPRMVYRRRDRSEKGEFDLVAINGKEIVAIEVKTTLTSNKVEKYIDKLKHFKTYFSEYQDKIIYGGMAYLDDYDEASSLVMKNGMLAIKAVGGKADVSVIVNANGFELKQF